MMSPCFFCSRNSAYLDNKVSTELDITWNNEDEKITLLFSLITICPGIVSFRIRHKMFYFLTESENDMTFEISRDHVLSDIMEVFNTNLDDLTSFWDFTLTNELGKGHGPTKEVYALLSQELQKHEMDMWQGEPALRSSEDKHLYTYSPNGLFPKHVSEITTNSEIFFTFLGKVLATVLTEGQLLDIPLSNEFFYRLNSTQYNHLIQNYYKIPQAFPMLNGFIEQLITIKGHTEAIISNLQIPRSDREKLISNLKFEDGNSFEDLILNFTVPGTEIELKSGGKDITLIPNNVELYLTQLSTYIQEQDPISQFQAIKNGFGQVLPTNTLNMFLPEELKHLICGEQFKKWTLKELQESCKICDYKRDSKQINFLFEILTSFDDKQQKMFIEFVTGTTVLPYGGLSAMKPRLTISKMDRDNSDCTLPTSATCFNRLYLPNYNSLKITKEKLLYAICNGNKSFQIV